MPRISEPNRARKARDYQQSFAQSYPNPPVFQVGAPGVMDETATELSSTQKSSPDSALTAWLQLITFRLGVRRAMISLVDQSKQYFLAESTKSTELGNTAKHNDSNDGLWMGCAATPVDEAICAYTIKAPFVAKGYSFFSILDLSTDQRTCNLPYVKGPPYFRFYAGTPLTTKAGIRIGAVFVLDDQVHRPMSPDDVEFLGMMSNNVMKYLDMQREHQLRKRHLLMSRGLAAFVERQCQIPPNWYTESMAETGTNPAHARSIDIFHEKARVQSISDAAAQRRNQSTESSRSDSSDLQFSIAAASHDESHAPRHQIETRNDSTGSHDRSEDGDGSVTDLNVLARASNLLRESLDVDFTAFYDASPGAFFGPQRGFETIDENGQPSAVGSPSSPGRTSFITSFSKVEASEQAEAKHMKTNPQNLAKLLSFSSNTRSSVNGDEPGSNNQMHGIEKKFVQSIYKNNPEGKIWSFDENYALVSADDDPMDLSDDETSTSVSEKHAESINCSHQTLEEARELQKSFPGARQILLGTLLNKGANNSEVACFAVSSREVPVFTTAIEVSFVRAFMNSVAAECDRVGTAMADKQKGNFISSISHELRTPLHGILASTETLLESMTTGAQKSLCNTIDSCGRMLLDTITHILEYSKINTFRHSNRGSSDLIERLSDANRKRNVEHDPKSGIETSLEIYSWVDLALLCEEVVEVVSAGHLRWPTPDVVPRGELSADVNKPASTSNGASGTQKAVMERIAPIAIALDISHAEWQYFCTPGAFRTILLNLVGNSLKYTKRGYVKIDLSQDASSAEHRKFENLDLSTSAVIIKVTDTGRGISEDFMRSKIFTSFCQESTLEPGIGLGLSMTKSIVEKLQGTIGIQSEVGHGTEITVRLPLLRLEQYSSGPSPVLTDPSVLSHQGTLRHIQSCFKGQTVTLYGFDSRPVAMVARSLRQYLRTWLGMVLRDYPEPTNLVILNVTDLSSITSVLRSTGAIPTIACCETSQLDIVKLAEKETTKTVVTLLRPIGPFKLAASLLDCLPDAGDSAMHTAKRPLAETLMHLKLDQDRQSTNASTSAAPSEQTDKITTRGPPREATKDEDASKQTAPNDNGNRIDREQPRILCVDDNSINLTVLNTYMKRLGHSDVETARDGLEAFEAAKRRTSGFDFIFMDLSMPVCDGFESTRKIRGLERQRLQDLGLANSPTPATIIALTGLGSSCDQQEAFGAGVDYFVTKPFKFAGLQKLMAGVKRPDTAKRPFP